MNDTEINIKKAQKNAVAAFILSRWAVVKERHKKSLTGAGNSLILYLEEVVSNPNGHNVYELLAVKRFFDLLDKYPFKVGRVRKFFKFYHALRFSGLQGRRHYKLTPVQCFQFANIYGFALPDGRRLCRTAYIFVPRKFSKTTSAAAMAVYDMLFGDDNAQAYVGANSYDQAKVCFDEVRNIMFDLDGDGKNFQVNREKITFKGRHRHSFIQCLTANAKTKDGLFASLVIMDEYAQARNTAGKNGADLRNVLTTSMGPRVNPLLVIITTASEVVDGPFAHELEGVKKVLEGEQENDTIFASLFMPDAWDEESDPKTWAKVQPHLGVTVRPDYYEQEYRTAQLSDENMVAFRTKLLNVFAISAKERWFTYEKAQTLLGNFDIDHLKGMPLCAVAYDLSVHDDFSAVSYTYYSSSTKSFYCHTDYYFPEGALVGHPNEQLYRRWHKDGHLKLCQGSCIDVRMIADDILSRSKRVRIIRIGYDAYKAQDLTSILLSIGGKSIIQPYGQTNGNFNLPVESFEMLAYAEPPKIVLNNNPINVYCLCNCVLTEDNLENKKPVKISQYQKIDGTITMLMTLGQLYRYER